VSAPLLYINYPDGAPGSIFLIAGYQFPAGATIQFSINGVVVGSLFNVDPDGIFTALVTTDGSAAEGYYAIVATVIATPTNLAQISSDAADQQIYRIATDAPVRQIPSGAPPVVAVLVPPSVPAFAKPPVIYLPLVGR
jgi:hypothetical protein